jgi:hypothetical protein
MFAAGDLVNGIGQHVIATFFDTSDSEQEHAF